MRKQREITCSDPLVLAEMEKIIAQHGVGGFRLGDVSRLLGMSEARIRRRYGGLASLKIAVSTRLTVMLALEFSDPEPLGVPTRATLGSYIDRWVDFCFEHPAYVRLCLHDVATQGELLGSESAQAGSLAILHRRFSDLLRDGHRRGEVRLVAPVELCQLISGALLAQVAAAQSERRDEAMPRPGRNGVKRLIWEMAWGYLTVRPAHIRARSGKGQRARNDPTAPGARRLERLRHSTRCAGRRLLQ